MPESVTQVTVEEHLGVGRCEGDANQITPTWPKPRAAKTSIRYAHPRESKAFEISSFRNMLGVFEE
jgi:hypothetical protein